MSVSEVSYVGCAKYQCTKGSADRHFVEAGDAARFFDAAGEAGHKAFGCSGLNQFDKLHCADANRFRRVFPVRSFVIRRLVGGISG